MSNDIQIWLELPIWAKIVSFFMFGIAIALVYNQWRKSVSRTAEHFNYCKHRTDEQSQSNTKFEKYPNWVIYHKFVEILKHRTQNNRRNVIGNEEINYANNEDNKRMHKDSISPKSTNIERNLRQKSLDNTRELVCYNSGMNISTGVQSNPKSNMPNPRSARSAPKGLPAIAPKRKQGAPAGNINASSVILPMSRCM